METKSYISTRNACKVCTPLGASVVFKGVEGCVPVIHGSQGCATYIRRYLISHYKEPVDIASTNFTEESAIYGGEANLFKALQNVTRQYKPKIIGISTTCLSETIGDDMNKLLYKYKEIYAKDSYIPELVYVNTPSYEGTHHEGFHNAVCALVKSLAKPSGVINQINLFPGFISPADIRILKEIVSSFGLESVLLPDYSDTLDNGHSGEYETIPEGGTSIDKIRVTSGSKASIEFGYVLNHIASHSVSAGEYLENKYTVPLIKMGLPIGIKAVDRFFEALKSLSGNNVPEKYVKERSRLVDSYIDGHKYVFGKKAVIYGEEDFIIAMVNFLEEIGIETILCASGGNSGKLKTYIYNINPMSKVSVHNNYDFEDIAQYCLKEKPDLLIGNSKGYYISRKLGIPLVRVGFPIHDRMGGQRIKHIGYEGTQELFEKITNTLIEFKQDHSPVGYKYM